MMENYHGIDYGLGRTNRDPQTGIRYGVIPLHALAHWALDEFESDYGEPTCPKCGGPAAEWTGSDEEDAYEEYRNYACEYVCHACELALTNDDVYPEEPVRTTLENEEYAAQADSDGDVFITRSKYFTHAQYCSPCAPGACYLLKPVEADGPRAYCFGHEWFEGGVAPYPVYDVATGGLVVADCRADPTADNELHCHECGELYVENENGTTNHVTEREPDGRFEIDHDADADHVAYGGAE